MHQQVVLKRWNFPVMGEFCAVVVVGRRGRQHLGDYGGVRQNIVGIFVQLDFATNDGKIRVKLRDAKRSANPGVGVEKLTFAAFELQS